MRKNSKIITVLLSVVLAATLALTVFIQAFASEMGEDDYGYGNVASGDEAEESIYPVSVEVVKAPESVTVLNGDISDSTFWSNVVVHIVYSNGEEFDVNCDGIDSKGGIVPPIAEIDGYKGYIRYNTSYNDDTVNFTVVYDYAEYESEYGYSVSSVSADFSVKQIDDPHTIVSAEVTKLPDKVFTAPLFTGSREDIRNSFKSSEESDKWANSLDINNSISNNLDGMEVTCYYANGESVTVAIKDCLMYITGVPYNAMYGAYNVDEYGKYGNRFIIFVRDEGDYKFSVAIKGLLSKTYTAKSASNPNPSINGEGTNDTPANPSDNKSSATSDVATNDNANNNNGTTNNGVVATGAVSIAVITLTVLVALTVAMYVWRKRNSGKA